MQPVLIELAANILEPMDKLLQTELLSDTNVHFDELTLKPFDRHLPGKTENEDDVELEKYYFKCWIFYHYSPLHSLLSSSSMSMGVVLGGRAKVP